ncbi:MAG TPA: hypothetical protein VFA33_26505 [Bryobacteraceae bacterium]|nr:hypothetical protein [Bryobacteraceae bacterium]
MAIRIPRRALVAAPLAAWRARAAGSKWELATFRADVTPPLGSPLFNAVLAKKIVDPLGARGLVLRGAGSTYVLAVIDWCEIRNNSYDRWRSVLAETAGTSREKVLVSCVHQHDAPYTDRRAQELLTENHVPEPLCDTAFEDRTIRNVAAALGESLRRLRPVSHIGTGMARVEQVASNRRYVLPDGRVSFERTSATRDPAVRAQPEGLIDPWLRTLSFWNGGRPLAALSVYSTHPMSYYGKGEVSADFPGMAREARQQATPDALQIYASGASGDTMAGKYNDGSPANRPVLAGRMRRAMEEAWKNTRPFPLEALRFRNAALRMEPRRTPGFSLQELKDTLADPRRTRLARFEAALGLSWRERLSEGRPIDVPCLELAGGGKLAHVVLVPAESFVQYQLWAQQMRPDSFVVTVGFSECAPGYIPTAESAREGYNDHYSWIAFPECEKQMRGAIGQALGARSA